MPIFEYQCAACGKSFELFLRNKEETPACKYCQSIELERKVSVFAFQGSGIQGSASSGASCSGCSATGCGTCKG